MFKTHVVMLNILPLLLLGLNPVNAWASKTAEQKWSFEFQNVSVKEALTQISVKAGVAFAADEQLIENTLAKQKLYKSYHNKNLDKIIQDIFKKDNCAFTWLYKNNQLNQVDIWIVEGPQEKKPGMNKTGRPGAFHKSAKTGLSRKNASQPFKQSVKKNPRKFKNSKRSAFSRPGRRAKSRQTASLSSSVPSSSVSDISDNAPSPTVSGTKANSSETSSYTPSASASSTTYDAPGSVSENSKSDTSSSVAESYKTDSSTDDSAQSSKTDTAPANSKMETVNSAGDDLSISKADGISESDSVPESDIVSKADSVSESDSVSEPDSISKADGTSDNAAEENEDGIIVAKADNQNENSDDNPSPPAAVSKAWLVEQMQMASVTPSDTGSDEDSGYKSDVEMP